MMLYPPVADLVNKVGSSYALVNLVAKRARELSSEAERDGYSLTKKPVSSAIEEVYTGKLMAAPQKLEDPEIPEEEAAEEDAPEAGEEEIVD